MIKFILISITIISLTSPLFGQKLDSTLSKIDRNSFLIHFRVNSYLVDKHYLDKSTALKRLNTIIAESYSMSKLGSITISATTSPEGIIKHNEQLIHKRSAALRKYLILHNSALKDIILTNNSQVREWSELIPYVETDDAIIHKNLVLKLLKNQNFANLKRHKYQKG